MLRKSPQRTFVPGTPTIPFVPAHDECPPPPPGPPFHPGDGSGGGGGYDMVCETIQTFLGWDQGPASFDNPGPFPKPIYVDAVVCRSESSP